MKPVCENTDAAVDRCTVFKQRLGIVLCVVYALIYTGFVVIAVYDVSLMDAVMPFGLNLAVFYGLGLIVLALVLGILYSLACYFREKNTSIILPPPSTPPSDSENPFPAEDGP